MQIPFKSVQILSVSMLSVGLAVMASGCGSVSLVQEKTVKPSLTAFTLQGKGQDVQEDFDFPAAPPKLSVGKKIFQENCAKCHSAGALSYNGIKSVRPVEQYLLISSGNLNGKSHPTVKNVTRDERWASVWYYRFLSGQSAYSYPKKDLASIYGANCAVCHGKGGKADGSLYSGHASAHELGMAPYKNAFYPPPANFRDYSRFYNRTDDIIVKHIAEGLYPSAMPSWYGRKDKDRNFVFDEPFIRELVYYVREFSYENDLPDEEQIAPRGVKAGNPGNSMPAGLFAGESYEGSTGQNGGQQ